MSDPSYAEDFRTPNYFDHYWYNEGKPPMPPTEPGTRGGPLSDVFGFLMRERRAGRLREVTEEEIKRMTPEQREQLAQRLLEFEEEEEEGEGPEFPPRPEEEEEAERRFGRRRRLFRPRVDEDKYGDDDEEPIGIRRPDFMLGNKRFNQRLTKDREAFEGRQNRRNDRFDDREKRRRKRWAALRRLRGARVDGHYNAEGSGAVKPAESVFSPDSHSKLFKRIIGFTDDHIEEERSEAIGWARRKFGLDFSDAKKRGKKLVLSMAGREVATMSPFVIHPEIEMSGGHHDKDTTYAGGYIFEITAPAGIDLGGKSATKVGKCGSIMLYGDYYIEHNGDGNNISAVHFDSMKAAVPDEDGNVTIALDLRDNFGKTVKSSKGRGKMIVERDGDKATVSNSLKFKSGDD